MIEQPEPRHEVAQQQHLADAVEHVGAGRQSGVTGVVGQDPLAEAVEVADRHPGGISDADGRLDPLAQFGRCLHVVGQDEQVLGLEVFPCLEEVADPFDNDACLPGAGSSDDHGRPVAPLDDPLLLVG